MILLYFHIWLLGVLAASTRHLLIKNDVLAWGIFAAFLVGSRVSFRPAVWRGPVFGWALETIVAPLFTQTLITTKCSLKETTLPFANLHKWLSDRSFSVYAIHLPILIMMVIALCNRWFDMPWSGRPVVAQAIWCFVETTITLLALFGFHQVFETKHMKLRFILLDIFNRITNYPGSRNISLGDSKR